MPSFKMLVTQGKDPTLFSDQLVSEVDGRTLRKFVFTIYALVSNFEEIALADTLEKREKRFVLDETNPQGIRVTQAIHKVNDIGFYSTTKLSHPESQLVEQVQCPISSGMYNHLALVSEYGIQFERAKFPVPNSELIWEVDIYKSRSGERSHWVRADLEVSDIETEVPKMPFACDDYIFDFPGVITDEQRLFIEKLYKHEWVSLDPNWIMNQLDYKERIGKEVLEPAETVYYNEFDG